MAVGPRLGAGDTEVQPTAIRATTRTRVTRREPVAEKDGVMAELWTRLLDICFFTVCHLVASRCRPIFSSAEEPLRESESHLWLEESVSH